MTEPTPASASWACPVCGRARAGRSGKVRAFRRWHEQECGVPAPPPLVLPPLVIPARGRGRLRRR